MSSDREAVVAAYDDLDAAFDTVLGLSFDAITASEKLNLQHRMERNLRARTGRRASVDQLVGR
jgi:hypothetical protein